MLFALLAPALAAEPPPLDEAVKTGARAKKDAAVVLCNEDYANLPDATNAKRDCDLVVDWLLQTRGVAVERLRRADDVTSAALRDELRAGAAMVKRKGTLWVYVAGHGATGESGAPMILGVEAHAEVPADGAMAVSDLVSITDGTKATRTIAILDVGFGGVGRNGEALFDGRAPSAGAAGVRTTVWSATSGAEAAALWPAAGHGMFTYFTVGALRGWADGASGTPADGKVTLQEAQTWVAKTLRQVGGPDWKPTRESRAELVETVLASGGKLEAGPLKEELAALALAEKQRRLRVAEEKIRGAAKAEWAVVGPANATYTPEAQKALEAFVAKWDAATVDVDGAKVAVAIAEVADARKRLDDFSRVANKGKKKKRKAKTARKFEPKAPPVSAATAACQDLLKVEPFAIAGELTPELVTCLEARLTEEARQTTKDKLSRLLIVNADSKGDKEEWARLVERHLEDIDRSDPDLCFKYALTVARGDVDDAPIVLRWTEYALENKHVWEGPTYVSRVNNILRLRAETGARLWADAEDDFLEDRTEENEETANRLRGEAKTFAKEWLDYARTAGQATERALLLCESASGSASACMAATP
ncbi:MAG: hypothetical protein ACOZNI_26110 [Myxococcota bacterium]